MTYQTEKPSPKEHICQNKNLGQHFLINQAQCKKIVNLLSPQPTDNIIEIGPGSGALTEFLDKIPHNNLVCLEKDQRFAFLLAQKIENGQLVLYDALKFKWAKPYGNWKIIGNLPYNIASPLIWDILSQTQNLELAVFMVQQEVGERIIANPGNRAYGALSVWCQCHADIALKFKVLPGSFSPPPRVNSVVLSFLPKARKPSQPEKLKALLKICFQQRRKQLGNILKNSPFSYLSKNIQDMDLSLKERPENLSPAQYETLSHFII